MKLSKAHLDKVLSQVTDSVAELLKHEVEDGEPLSKADEGEEAPAEATPEGSSLDSSGPPEADETSAGPPEASAAPPEASPEGAEASPEGQAPGGDPAQDQGATPEALQAEYAQLPVEDLKMHFLAAKNALMAAMAGGDPSGAPGGGPPGADPAAGPPGAPPPGAAPGPEASAGGSPPPGAPPPGAEDPMMGKKEFGNDGSGGELSAGSMAKSQNDIMIRLEKAEKGLAAVEGLKKSLAEKDATITALEENIGKVAAGFQKLMTGQQAMRKSVSGISFVQKPGAESPKPEDIDITGMTKSELVQRLGVATSSPDLSKSDRETINRFVVGNDVPASTIAKFIK